MNTIKDQDALLSFILDHLLELTYSESYNCIFITIVYLLIPIPIPFPNRDFDDIVFLFYLHKYSSDPISEQFL